jgi:hypothetical protein
MPVDTAQQLAVSPKMSLPPIYSDLLTIARRMQQIAQARCWTSLLDEEIAFFRAYERVARHESRPVSAQNSKQEQALREQVHRDVAHHVAEARRLLLVRQAELGFGPGPGNGPGKSAGEGAVEACTLPV